MLKPNRFLILPSLFLFFTGCRGIGTQRFVAVSPSQAHELEASSSTVLDVRCSHVMGRADYSLCENLHMLAPVPKRMKLDVTAEIEHVIRGDFDNQTLQLHWLRSPTCDQSLVLGIPYHGRFSHGFTNGMVLRIGFDGRSGQRLRHLKILIRHD